MRAQAAGLGPAAHGLLVTHAAAGAGISSRLLPCPPQPALKYRHITRPRSCLPFATALTHLTWQGPEPLLVSKQGNKDDDSRCNLPSFLPSFQVCFSLSLLSSGVYAARSCCHRKLAHVCHYLTALAGCARDRPLLVCGDVCRSASETAARVAALAAALRRDAGILRGDRVVLVAHSSASAFEAMLAVLAAGAVAAPLNLRWSAPEAAAAADLVGAAAVIFDAASAKLAAGMLSERGRAGRRVGIVLDGLGGGSHSDGVPGPLAAEALIVQHTGVRLEPVLAPGGAAVVCFTSGTTGAAKGALLSQAAFHCQVCGPPPLYLALQSLRSVTVVRTSTMSLCKDRLSRCRPESVVLSSSSAGLAS